MKLSELRKLIEGVMAVKTAPIATNTNALSAIPKTKDAKISKPILITTSKPKNPEQKVPEQKVRSMGNNDVNQLTPKI